MQAIILPRHRLPPSRPGLSPTFVAEFPPPSPLPDWPRRLPRETPPGSRASSPFAAPSASSAPRQGLVAPPRPRPPLGRTPGGETAAVGPLECPPSLASAPLGGQGRPGAAPRRPEGPEAAAQGRRLRVSWIRARSSWARTATGLFRLVGIRPRAPFCSSRFGRGKQDPRLFRPLLLLSFFRSPILSAFNPPGGRPPNLRLLIVAPSAKTLIFPLPRFSRLCPPRTKGDLTLNFATPDRRHISNQGPKPCQSYVCLPLPRELPFCAPFDTHSSFFSSPPHPNPGK